MKKRRYRRMAAWILAAALTMSAMPGQSIIVGAEETETQTETVTEAGTETITEAASGTETETVTETATEPATEPETEAITEPATEPETEPVTEPESPAETETVTEGETPGESETETEPVTETETEAQKIPQAQVQSASPAQNQILKPLNEIDEAVQNVQTQIDVLPSVEELAAMSLEEQQAVYEQVQEAYDAYEELTEEKQAQIDKTKIDVLFEYFNSMTATAEASDTQTENSVAKVGATYYDDLAEALNNAKGQTCDILKDTSLSGTYTFIGLQDAVTINLNGHTISGGFTLVLGGMRGSNLNGPGTIYGNVVITQANLNVPLTINGNILQNGVTNLVVSGSGILCVNGNIDDFGFSSEIANGVTIICTGTCNETDITPVTTKSINLGVSPSEGGTVTAAGDGVAMVSGGNAVASAGSTVTLNAVANQGYRFKEWQVTSGGVTINNNNNTFAMPDSDVSITAVFEELTGTTTQLTISGNISDGAADYGASINLAATVTGGNNTVNSGTVDFYRGEVSEANKINNGSITVSNGTAKLEGYQLSGEAWKPSDTPYTIIAVYTPVAGSGFLESRGDATLKINKATPSERPFPPNIMNSKTATSVTLNAVKDEDADTYGDIEYGYMTGEETTPGHWQSSPAFTNLEPGTDYQFYSRFEGNAYYNPSNPSYQSYFTTTLPDITVAELESGYVGVEYEAQLTATVAINKTVTWAVASGSLPNGLTLDAVTGTISGTPNETATSRSVTFRATIYDAWNDPVSNTATLSITINAGTPVITANTYNNTTQTDTFTYGDTITVSGSIAASSTAPSASNGISLLAEPAQNQVGLYTADGDELATANVDSDGSFILEYSTSGKGLSIGEDQTLTLKYGGNSALNKGETTVTITLNKKPVTVTFTGTTEKVYDGYTSAPEGLTIALSDEDVVGDDNVTVSADSIAYNSANVSEATTITAKGLSLSGDDSGWYTLSSTMADTSGSITAAEMTGTVTFSGSAIYNTPLTATYEGNAASVTWQWYLKDLRGTTAAISGATGSTYTPNPLDVDGSLYVVVTANDTNHTGRVTSQSVTVGRLPGSITIGCANVTYGQTPSPYVVSNTNTDVPTLYYYTGRGDTKYEESRIPPTEAGTYSVYAWVDSTQTHSAATSAPVEFTIAPANLSGTLEIAGQAIYGETLTAVYTPVNNETVAYQWYRGDMTISNATGRTYTLTADDVGQVITVTAAATDGNHQGGVTSEATAAVARASQTAPESGEGYTIDYAAETISAESSYELAISGDESSGESSLKLTPGNDPYFVYIRFAETSTHSASPWTEVTIPARPALDVEVTGVTAKGFTVTVTGAPTDAALTYRATGTGEYASYDSGEQTSGTFTGLKANAVYNVSVECAATNNSFSAEATTPGTTSVATFTVSIPSQAAAGGDPVSISIDSEAPFDLGTEGRVNVKIMDDDNINDGVLTLTREGASNTVTSALSVNGRAFTNLDDNIATFTENSKESVSLSFAAPTENNIPAGTYKGTVNFEISYSQ